MAIRCGKICQRDGDHVLQFFLSFLPYDIGSGVCPQFFPGMWLSLIFTYTFPFYILPVTLLFFISFQFDDNPRNCILYHHLQASPPARPTADRGPSKVATPSGPAPRPGPHLPSWADDVPQSANGPLSGTHGGNLPAAGYKTTCRNKPRKLLCSFIHGVCCLTSGYQIRPDF